VNVQSAPACFCPAPTQPKPVVSPSEPPIRLTMRQRTRVLDEWRRDEGSAHGGEVLGRMSGRLNRISAVAPWGDVSWPLPQNNIRAIAAWDHVGRRSSPLILSLPDGDGDFERRCPCKPSSVESRSKVQRIFEMSARSDAATMTICAAGHRAGRR
jgi:hypothetical protein